MQKILINVYKTPPFFPFFLNKHLFTTKKDVVKSLVDTSLYKIFVSVILLHTSIFTSVIL